jgi:long-chain fatty acid transport protein
MGEFWRIAARATYALNKVTVINVHRAMVWRGDRLVDETRSMPGTRTSGQFVNA